MEKLYFVKGPDSDALWKITETEFKSIKNNGTPIDPDYGIIDPYKGIMWWAEGPLDDFNWADPEKIVWKNTPIESFYRDGAEGFRE